METQREEKEGKEHTLKETSEISKEEHEDSSSAQNLPAPSPIAGESKNSGSGFPLR